MIDIDVSAEALTPWPAPRGSARSYHIMVKPIGSSCNLRCSYCYYLHKGDSPSRGASVRISDEVLETHIRQYLAGQDHEEVVFSWQGGEPTLLGVDFFRNVVRLQAKYQRPGQRICNDVQTNGTLLDEEWCEFLREHDFLVGLSIDGPRVLHDAYRLAASGRPTFDRVLAASRLLHHFGVKFNTLTVVNSQNATRPLDVYRFLRSEVRPYMMQFIPCVETKTFREVAPQRWEEAELPVCGSNATRPGTKESVVTDWSVDPDAWGYFLCKVWDDWYKRDFGKVFVNLFETAVAQWMGMDAQLCVYHDFCGKNMALEHDGNLYACDHYVYLEYRRGNIMSTSSSRMVFGDEQRRFGFAKSESLPKQCRECNYLFACNGECPRNRFVRTRDGEPGLNYLCPGLHAFWRHIDPCMNDIVRRIRQAGAPRRSNSSARAG